MMQDEAPTVRARAGLVAAAGMLAIAVSAAGQGVRLGWDEVDYVQAARLGVWANAVEAGSLPAAAFVELVRAKRAGHAEPLPAGYDEARDPLLLRHYHPPLITMLQTPVAWLRSDRGVRSVQLVGAGLLVGSGAAAYRSAGGGTGPGLAAVLALLVWMAPRLFRSIGFHGWQAIWAMAAAALAGRWLDGQRRRAGVLLAASLALAVLTLETGVLVCLGVAVVLLGGGTPAARAPARLATGLGLIVALILVAWPGAVLRLSAVKIPALYLYRIALGAEYGAVLGRLPAVLAGLAPVLLPGALAALWLARAHQREARRWAPFAVIGVVYAAGVLPFVIAPQYLLPAAAAFVAVVGLAVDRLPRPGRLLVVALASLLAAITAAAAVRTGTGPAGVDDVTWLGETLRGREALVDGAHIYRHYLGSGYVIQPLTVAADGSALFAREGGAYRALGPADVAGRLVVVQAHRARVPGGVAERTLLAACPRRDRPTVRVYDCPTR
jgi:hypothetical protein